MRGSSFVQFLTNKFENSLWFYRGNGNRITKEKNKQNKNNNNDSNKKMHLI